MERLNDYEGALKDYGSSADLRNSLTALFDAGDHQGLTPSLSTLLDSLRARKRVNSRVVDALLLIDDLAAERGD